MARFGRLARRGILLAGGAGAAGAIGMVKTKPESGFARSMRFWVGALPMYTHYKVVEWRTAAMTDAEARYRDHYEPLNEMYAPRVEALTLELQGFYYKLAQVVSTRDEFLPDQYMQWAKRLQDRSPRVMSPEDTRAVVEDSLGVAIDEVFSEWDEKPIGAASIGQVHRAVLRETGEAVAVKVQFPGIEEKFRNDIATVELFCRYLMPQNLPYFSEVKKQFQTEFDYIGEARNLAEVSANLEQSQWRDRVAVPHPIMNLCTKTVLTMTYLEGERMIDGIRAQFKRLAESQGKDLESLEEEQKELMRSGKLQLREISDSARSTTKITWLLSAYDYFVNTGVFLGNWTVAPVLRMKQWEYVKSEAPINLGAIIETLLRVHAQEIFADGAFNADPHPGNILLMPDGRLGLVDYGQFKRMSVDDRIIYAKLILALHRDDREEVVRLMTDEIGYKTKYMNKDMLWRVSAFWNDRDTEEVTLGRNVHHFMEWVQEQDPPVQVNDEFILVARVSILLRGMANAFGLKVRVSDYWHFEAEEFLKSKGIDY